MNPNDLRQALIALGETPEEVCNSLRAKGIKGMRKKPDCCPIANYLCSLGVEGPLVSAIRFSGYVKGTHSSVMLFDSTMPVAVKEPPYAFFDSTMPVAVGSFITDFDHGWYSSLLEEK